jgi:hypothetical protein
MAGYRETFGSNVDYAYSRGARDIAGSLQRGLANISSSSSGLSRMSAEARGARRSIDDLTTRMGDLRAQVAAATNPAQITRLISEFGRVADAADQFKKRLRQMPFDALERGLAKVTKGLIGMNAAILGVGFDFLVTSVKRVYELQERWTRAIGAFNLRIGGMTAGLRGAQKAATSWSSTIRGLTDGDITEGIQMFADFTDAIGRTVESGDKFQKFGLQLSRGFNLGGQGAGQLTKVFENIGDSGDSAAETIARMVKAANLAHVPTNLLAKDIQESSVYMARFGKESEKTFVTGAAFVRKFTISMEQLRKSVEGLDMFDEAARTASKLNVAFGTMINSMDLMLEDDPAKRLEDIRQQFLAQGTTFDKLTPKQRRYLSETLKLTEDQTASLLSAQHAGESYSEFQEKASKREKQDLNAKALMQKQLQATAQTMYAFGMAFDRVTVSIANAIRPILKVLGLAGDGTKKFKSFGEVMESITTTVEAFFNSLARNDKWNSWVSELAQDLQKAGIALRDFVMSGRAAQLIGDIAKGMKDFYVTVRDLAARVVPALHPLLDVFLALSQHIKGIAVAWGAMKGFNALGGINMLSKAGGARLGGGLGGRLGMAGLSAGVGGAIGGTSAGIGAGLGSLVGGLFGPIGMVLGPIVGGLAGKAVEWLFGSTKIKTALEQAHEDLDKAIESETKKREAFTGVLDAVRLHQEAADRTRKARNDILRQMDDTAGKQKARAITLNEVEAATLRERVDELALFGKHVAENRKLLEGLGAGTKLTKQQLDNLLEGSMAYEDELSKLRDATKQQADLEMSRLQVSSIGQQKEALELITKLREAELKAAKQELSDLGGRVARGDSRLDRLPAGASAAGLLTAAADPKSMLNMWGSLTKDERKRLELESKIDKLDLDNTMDQKKLIGLQTDFLRQQTVIELRRAVMSDGAFLAFQKGSAEAGKSLEQQLLDFVNSGQSALANDPYALSLLREGSSLKAIATGTRVQATPVEASSQIQVPPEFNLASPAANASYASGAGSDINVNLFVDGQKLAGTVVKSTVRGRD